MPELTRVADISMLQDVHLEAWLYHFLAENNLDYLLIPSIVSSPEQLRFIVALRDDQLYFTGSDALFLSIYSENRKAFLRQEYTKAWRFIISLVRSYGRPRSERRRVLSICRYRFQGYCRESVILPSRLIKRLVAVVLTQMGDYDPFRQRKIAANARVHSIMQQPDFLRVLRQAPPAAPGGKDIPGLRWELDVAEMSRLAIFSTMSVLWEEGFDPLSLKHEVTHFGPRCDVLREVFGAENAERKKILFIPDVAGGFMLDIALVNSFLRQGHQVLLVLKDAFYFNSPIFWDIEVDPLVKNGLEGAHFLSTDSVTKNELLQLLREHRLVVLSDGTSEQMNFYRTSVSFARAWKECDVVVAKGRRNKQVLLDSSHEFTRDCVCFWRDDSGEFFMELKRGASWVRKFTEKDLTAKAREIIHDMRSERRKGNTIMFYSAVIGSIPGQTKTAIELVNTFVQHLRERLDSTFIINPAEHFEEGMDGDDLMFMWEQVQRSGFLDVWRFQTVEDIETSFRLLRRKVPSVWSGKDSTFSTGCTKEMHIALDVQRHHPELQIIGPASEKFFRRRDYGIGKYYDATLKA